MRFDPGTLVVCKSHVYFIISKKIDNKTNLALFVRCNPSIQRICYNKFSEYFVESNPEIKIIKPNVR